MEEKEKKPWRPPEAAQLPDPIAFAMQGFERFGLPKERLIPIPRKPVWLWLS